MHDALDGMLEQLNRREWLAEDAARAVANAENDAPERWPHLSMRAAQFLDGEAQRRLVRLLRWRDGYARDNDRPRGWILDNELATQLARTPPADRATLQSQLDAHPKAPRKLGDAIWRALSTPLADEAEAPDASVGEARDKQRLRKLWVDTLGLTVTGNFKSERENVDEDITALGSGPFKVEVDLMQPIDPEKKPKVNDPPLNHVGLWIDDLQAAVAWLEKNGVRFTPGGIRKGAAGFDVCFIHPKGNDEAPIGGEGVLIELVQAPREVIDAFARAAGA